MPPVIDKLLSVVMAVLNTSFCQSVFADPKSAICVGVPCLFISDRRESPDNTSAYLAMVEVEILEFKVT